MNGKRVLALVPAYNPHRTALKRTIDSLFAQTVATDICVIDDGSEIPVLRLVGDAKVILLRLDRNGGIARALQAGVRFGLDNGYDYFCRLDVGDVAYPHRVARQLAHMEANEAIDLLGAFANIVDLSGRRVGLHGIGGGPKAVRRYLWKNAAFKHSSFFVRARALRDYGNYDPAYCSAEDYELALRIAQKGIVDCLNEVLIDYIDNPSGISASNRLPQLQMRLKAQCHYARPLEPRWYLGIARTLMLMATPPAAARVISRLRWRPAAMRASA
jgi:GT2 family glycosyltransferase